MKVKKRIIKCLVLSLVSISILASLIIPSFASSDGPPMYAVRPVDPGYSVPGSVPVILTYDFEFSDDSLVDLYYNSPYATIVDPLFNDDETFGYSDMTYVTDGSYNFEVSSWYGFFDYDPGTTQFYLPSDGSLNACDYSNSFGNFYGVCSGIQMEARGFYVDPNGVDSDSLFTSQVQFILDDNEYFRASYFDVFVSYVKAGDLDDGLNRMVYETTFASDQVDSYQLVPDSFIESLDDGLYYVEYIKVKLRGNLTEALQYGTVDYSYISVYNDFRDRDILSYTPPETPMDPGIFADYTSWIGTAVGGFIDLEIVQGFTLGGILMTIIGFLIAVWFLKLLAGG